MFLWFTIICFCFNILIFWAKYNWYCVFPEYPLQKTNDSLDSLILIILFSEYCFEIDPQGIVGKDILLKSGVYWTPGSR